MYFFYARLSLFFWIWTKPDASQLAVARNANDSRLLLGRCYGNERTATVVLKCCIQGDCSVSGGCCSLSRFFFFFIPPPPLSAIIWSDRKREKFLKQLERTAREWWKLFSRSPVFSHSRREPGIGPEARYCELWSYPGASHFFWLYWGTQKLGVWGGGEWGGLCLPV